MSVLGETATEYSQLTGGVCSHPDRDRRSGLHRSVSSNGRVRPVIFVSRIQDLLLCMSVQRSHPPKRQPLQRFSHSSLFIDPPSRLAPQSVTTSRRSRNAKPCPNPLLRRSAAVVRLRFETDAFRLPPRYRRISRCTIGLTLQLALAFLSGWTLLTSPTNACGLLYRTSASPTGCSGATPQPTPPSTRFSDAAMNSRCLTSAAEAAITSSTSSDEGRSSGARFGL